MTVRPATPSDIPAILAMVRELAEYERAGDEVVATEEQLHDALFAESATVHALVVEHRPEPGASPEPAGFALYFLNFSTWLGRSGIYLEDLYVRPDRRGHGYGKALLGALAARCMERGYGRLEWSVLRWNEPAIGFYRNLGAEPLEEWIGQRLTGDALHRLGAR